MSILVGVGDVVSAASALVALRDRGISAADIVMLVGDMDPGSEARPDPRTVPEMAAVLSGVGRVEALNALMWPQVPQGWRASDLVVDGVGRLLVELEDTLEEVIVADDHPAWDTLARASRPARVTWLSVGPSAYPSEGGGEGSPVGSAWVHLDLYPGRPARTASQPVPITDVAALLAPLRSARPPAGAAVWVPNASALVDRDVAEVAALMTVAARNAPTVDVLVQGLPPLPGGWFDEVAAGELLQAATIISDDVGAEAALLRHPVDTLVTTDSVLAARAGLLGVRQVRLVDRSEQDSRYDMMVTATGGLGRTTEGQDAVKDDEPRGRVAPRRVTRQFRMSKLGVLSAGVALVAGAVAVVLIDSLLGSATAMASIALLLGGLGIVLAAAVVWEIRAHRREVRAGRRELETALRDLQTGLRALRTSVRELGEQQDGHRTQLAAIEQRGTVIAAMQQRTVVAIEDIARVAALLAVRAETVADRSDDR